MAVRLGVLGLLAWLTLRQEPVFFDDMALWSHAAAVNQTSPRPAYNLGVLWRKAEFTRTAVEWFLEAGRRASRRPEQDAMRRKIAAQLQYLEMMGHPVCAQPSVQPYCS